MKTIILGWSIIALIAVAFLTSILFTIPVIKGYSSCYQKGTSEYSLKLTNLPKDSQNKQNLCAVQKYAVDYFSACFEGSQYKNAKLNTIYSTAAQFLSPKYKQVEQFKSDYLLSCKEFISE